MYVCVFCCWKYVYCTHVCVHAHNNSQVPTVIEIITEMSRRELLDVLQSSNDSRYVTHT